VARRRQEGSVVLFILFVCLAVAVLVQTLTAITLCANRASAAEDAGRLTLSEKDRALVDIRGRSLRNWGPSPTSVVSQGEREVWGEWGEVPLSEGWLMSATVWQEAELSRMAVSADVERGRDGLDLPLAALVASTVSVSSGRISPWLEVETGGDAGLDPATTATPPEGASAHLLTAPPTVPPGPGVTVSSISTPWTLDDGWRLFLEEGASGLAASSAQVSVIVDKGPAYLPAGWGASQEIPGLVIVSGGGSLDAQGLGDVYGVMVVDGGDILLDGTRVHGAVFVTGAVDFGQEGAVFFSRSVLRWATDRSLVRTRLVPGTREESIG